MKLVEYRKIAPSLNVALTAALKESGLDVAKLNASIDERTGEIRLSIIARDPKHVGADGNITTPEIERYRLLCSMYDLKPEWLGQTFRMGGKDYKVAGLKRAGTKCVVLDHGGKTFVSTAEQVKMAFALAAQQKGAAA